MTTPYLSTIVTTRNDNHGGNLTRRTQFFIDGFIEQACRHNLSSELVIVEWNPPSDKPRLAQAMKWPEETGPCTVRIIEVPPYMHRRFQHSDRLPLFQMIGKNVGIRRAKGRFILATNIDILFSDEMIDFIVSEQLDAHRMYRVDRYDVPLDLPDGGIDKQLAYCRENILRIYGRHGVRVLPGNAESTARPWKINAMPVISKLQYFLQRKKPPLHINACGDFTLMAREHWFKVRGYSEMEIYSWNLDALLCYTAHYAGAKEILLKDPMRIYHMEHSSGWQPGEMEKLMYQRLKKDGIPWLDWKECIPWVKQMARDHNPIIFNQEDWGLANENLPEEVIAKTQ